MQVVQNYFLYFLDYWGLINVPYILNFKDGISLYMRPRCKMEVGDIDILEEVLFDDIYKIKKNISENDTIVDIGSHIGIFALLAAKSAKNGHVFAFEPASENFKLLQSNVILNNLDNLKVYRYAVDAKKGFVNLYLSKQNVGAHTLFGYGNEQNLDSSQVESIDLEYIFETFKIDRINLLKLDCEGCEYPILLNSSETLIRRIDRIILEEHNTDLISNIYPSKVLENLLLRYDFEVSILKEVLYEGEGFFRILYACYRG